MTSDKRGSIEGSEESMSTEQKPSILFMGTPDFAVPALELLVANGLARHRRRHAARPAQGEGARRLVAARR
ncbi:MAG: hypothetical protein MZU91_04575 [Desulfosudis oleivorans]|nr:hypothetical protein [Desulfosudis oleivorans]